MRFQRGNQLANAPGFFVAASPQAAAGSSSPAAYARTSMNGTPGSSMESEEAPITTLSIFAWPIAELFHRLAGLLLTFQDA